MIEKISKKKVNCYQKYDVFYNHGFDSDHFDIFYVWFDQPSKFHFTFEVLISHNFKWVVFFLSKILRNRIYYFYVFFLEIELNVNFLAWVNSEDYPYNRIGAHF